MSFIISFLVSLAISVCLSLISALLMPQQNSRSSSSAGELDAPTAQEGIPIMHVRGTRFVNPNCLWWAPMGTTPIKK